MNNQRKRYILTAIVLACLVLVCGLKLPRDFAFKLADGQTFHLRDVTKVEEIKLATEYRRPYMRLSVDYEIAPFKDGYQDLMQTADVNDGLRIEFGNRTSGVVFATGKSSDAGGIQVNPLLRYDHRQQMTIASVADRYVNIRDSETGQHFMGGPRPHFLLNHILIGQGFDESRKFIGKIYAVDLSVCEYTTYRNALAAQYGAMLVLVLAWTVVMRRAALKEKSA